MFEADIFRAIDEVPVLATVRAAEFQAITVAIVDRVFAAPASTEVGVRELFRAGVMALGPSDCFA